MELVGPGDRTSTNELLTVIGMGFMTDTGPRAFKLIAAELRLSPGPLDSHYWINLLGDVAAYNAVFKPYGPGVLLSFEDGIGPCNGDSGGALLANRRGIQFLVGVNSFVKGECGALAGYSSVSYFYNWIKTTSGL